MQAHIIDLQRLVRLTQNPDTLRVLREAIRTAQLLLRKEARNTRRATQTRPSKCGCNILGLYAANFLMLIGEDSTTCV